MSRRSNSNVVILAMAALVILVGCEIDKVDPDSSPPVVATEADLANNITPIDGPSTGDIVFDATLEIYAMADNATDYRRLTRDPESDVEPSTPLDGTTVYYRCWVFGSKVCALKPGGSVVTLNVPRVSITSVAVSPDGESLLITDVRDMRLYDLASDTSRLLTDDQGDADPTWTPDGGVVWVRNQKVVSVPASQVSGGGLLTPTILGPGRDPDVSADGTTIAYALEGDVWTMNIDGSGPTKLTVTPFPDQDPSWSPDSTRIAYTRLADTAALYEELYIMNADGTGVRRMTTTDGVAEQNPDWTNLVQTATLLPPACAVEDPQCVHSVAEGDSGNTALDLVVGLSEKPSTSVTVNYRVVAGSAQATQDYVPLAQGTVTFAPNETTKTITVQVVGDTILEPDESFYVELLASTGVQLGVARRQGSITNDDEPVPTPTPTTTTSTSPSPTPSPSASGERIAFASARNGGATQLFTMATDGTDIKHVSADQSSSELSTPSWSSSGLRLIYTALNGAQPEIVDRPADGSGAYRLLVLDPSIDTDPVYVPGDSASGFVWSSDRDGDFELYYSTPGGTPKKLTTNTATDQAPTMSSDGRSIVYSSNSDGDFDLYRVTLSTTYDPVGSPVNLTQEASGAPKTTETSPDYAVTRNTIVFSGNEHGDFDIFKLDLTSMTETHLTTDAADELHPTMSPDGNNVAFVRDVGGNLEIFKQATVVGQTATALASNPAIDKAPDWGPATAI